MEHGETERRRTARLYMAGGLATAEREEFELHYFDCENCAGMIRDMVEADFGRAAGDPRGAPRRSLSDWLGVFWLWRPRAAHILAPACLALALVSYQAAGMQERLAPQPVAAFHLLPDDARSSDQRFERGGSGEFVVLTADVPEIVQEWKWQLRRSDGAGQTLEGIVSGPPRGALNLLVPTRRITSGPHVLTLWDANLVVPAITYRFRLL